jgi:hypothetical protein
MKIFATAILACSAFLCFSQEVIILKPNAIVGRDAVIYSNSVAGHNTINFGTITDFMACAWTNSGNVANIRGLIHFDLSAIPAGATITHAHLNLFFNPTSLNDGHSTLSGPNTCLLQRITSPWDETTVTWDTQPTTTTVGQVLIPATTTNNQNYGNINVTGLIDYFYNNPSQNYGMMLRQQTEVYYRSMLFASSDHTNPLLWPELIVYYAPPVGIEDHAAMTIHWINYASRVLAVKADAKLIEVYTVSGQKVFEYSPESTEADEISVQLPELSTGTYIIHVYGENGEAPFSKKIVLN